MATPKQIILIIGGGWHTPKSYSRLNTALETAGFEVHTPLHPSMNESRPPNADLNTDTDHIRSYTENLVQNGHKVIVLMHSYGGQVGTNALHGLGVEHRVQAGLTGGISSLIYMTACAVPEGKAMIDAVKHHGHEELMPLAFDFADDMSCVSRDPRTLLIGADSGFPNIEIEEYISTLVRWNGQCMYQSLNTERAAWRDIPVTYIHTAKDMTIPLDYQKWFVEEMRKEGIKVQTATLETGHCPNFTAADNVSKIVENVARGEMLVHNDVKETTKDDIKAAVLGIQG